MLHAYNINNNYNNFKHRNGKYFAHIFFRFLATSLTVVSAISAFAGSAWMHEAKVNTHTPILLRASAYVCVCCAIKIFTNSSASKTILLH